jgi:hypothetical protein
LTLTDDDQLVYVNNVIKGKLLESQELVLQASNNTKAQFANSPTLSKEIMNAVMDALAAHTTMSKQAIDSERVREGLKDVLLGPGQLYGLPSLCARGLTGVIPDGKETASARGGGELRPFRMVPVSDPTQF